MAPYLPPASSRTHRPPKPEGPPPVLEPNPSSQPNYRQKSAPPPLSDAERRLIFRTKYRPWLLAITAGIIVGFGAISGAGLKEMWQRQKKLQLREIEREAASNTSSGATEGLEVDVSDSGAETAMQRRIESERERQAKNKLIIEHVENLEARRRELLMKREQIVGKVQRLRERARRKEEEFGERERMERGKGTGPVRGVR